MENLSERIPLPRTKRAAIVAALFILLFVVPVQLLADGVEINEVVVFGDSYSDTGNFHLATGGAIAPPPAYSDGRWCNGPVWHEIVAEGLGVAAATPDITGGRNFAWGGALTGPGFSEFGSPNVGEQIATFLAFSTPSEEQLFVVEAGGNDRISSVFHRTPQESVDNLAAHVEQLALAGGKYFLIPNVPRTGNLPLVAALGPEAVQEQNAQSDEFNDLLLARLNDLERDLDVVIIKPNWGATFEFLLQFPAIIGVEDTTGTATLVPEDLTDGSVVDNPNSFFWLDRVHPTAAVQGAMGQFALARVKLRLAYEGRGGRGRDDGDEELDQRAPARTFGAR